MENCHFSSGFDNMFKCDNYRYSEFNGKTDSRRLFGLHWHEYYEIEFCVFGKSVNIINGITSEVSVGTLSMLKPGDFHKIIIDKDLGIQYRKLSFLPFVMSEEIARLVEKMSMPQIQYYSGENYTNLNIEFDKLKNIENRSSSNREIDIQLRRNAAESILLRVIENAYGHNLISDIKNKGDMSDDPIKIGMAYISSHISEEISLDTIAAQSCLNPSYFSRLFHKRTSMTLSQYIIECRMQMAAYMLRDTVMSVKDIAARTGYRSLSLFYTHFKAYYGITPLQIRDNCNNTI